MPSAVNLGVPDDGERSNRKQASQVAIALLADAAELVLAPLECCLGTSPTQAAKCRADRNALGLATPATKAVARAGPTPGISSSRRLVSLDRCQAMIRRSNSRIWVFSIGAGYRAQLRKRAPPRADVFPLDRQRHRVGPRHLGVPPVPRSRTRQGARGSN
jgi:hypothetical protein